MVDRKKIGKQNRAKGLAFERKVRSDLESKGWIVDKWTNNVEFSHLCELPTRLVPAKHKFRGPGIPMVMGTGFPDFICFQEIKVDKTILMKEGLRGTPINKLKDSNFERVYRIHGIESKSNGYLDKTEKEKCKWYLENNVFSKILIAKKGKKRGEITYNEFENGK